MMVFNRLYFLTILSLIFGECFVSAINFDIKNVVNINLNPNDRVEGSYFGYSLLLQKGSRPLVIVGAPKLSKRTGGGIFACDILNNNGCVKYPIDINNNGTFNGNFFGSSLDGSDESGDAFIACAPRKVLPVGSQPNPNYFLKGSCFWKRNSSIIDGRYTELIPLRKESPVGRVGAAGEYYYDNAFGQAGIDLFYSRDEVLLGATGIKNWNGAIVSQSLNIVANYRIIPQKSSPIITENYSYLGYKVGCGFHADSSFLFAGAPRADNLLGKVKLFHDRNYVNYRSFKGEEMGAYFGSAVLANDVNDDGADDLFIGAPTAAGSSFEEGCVYFYKNAAGTPIKLVGTGRRRARFGTNIVALGDINLDSFNDIAIAAPYENDGTGAVYIFMGSSDGIKNVYGQRLVPSMFANPALNVKGFGMGISRGNDIDSNGHNDLAVGAYKSGHVFVIPTKSVIDFRTALESNMTSITSNDNILNLRYCIDFKARSEESNIESVDFMFELTMDYRVKGSKLYTENVTVFREKTLCKTLDINLEQSLADVLPFTFILNTQPSDKVFAEGKSRTERSIPYSHGCGTDNICQTQILIDVYSDTKDIILGSTKSVSVNVNAENVGEPGYQCKLYMEVPKELELSQQRKCTLENSTYICPFVSRLNVSAEKQINFDVHEIDPTTLEFDISFEIKCLGENIENKDLVKFNIIVQNNPYIEGKSDPEDFEYNDESPEEGESEVILHHMFTLGNFGPSPIKTDVYLLIPQLQINKEDVFQLVEAKGILEGTQISCIPGNITDNSDNTDNVNLEENSSTNRTASMNCFGQNNCLKLFCEGDYLDSSSATAKYSLKVKTSTKLLANFLMELPDNKNILAYTTSAFVYNGTRVEGHATTLLLSLHATRVPLWVYVVSGVVGILLLCLLVFIFYKCHFFDRRYKEKMNGERLMDQNIEMVQENPNSEPTKEQDEESPKGDI
ncbi:integrin alpha-V [Diabrotica virgifera virgifera]|uniref:Integrin alpha second immunoglobulin-like domain-containing protein n=2 Tax=Diabrotica virgifera virgifera TaxID=50390 RepID=A0ABM5KB27_DIAVI|nr:integrin alpha-V [Diabrotica virgifera virgifera]